MPATTNSTARIVIDTESTRLWSRVERVSIELDGRILDNIRCGHQRTFFIGLGSHSLRASIGKSKSEAITFRLHENDCLNFRCFVEGHFKKSISLRPLFRREKVEARVAESSPHRFGRRISDVLPWYQVLNVRNQASFDEITAAYIRLMREYHPDKIADMSEVDKQYAIAQAKKISAAYAEAKAKVSSGSKS